jgi:hypothetical protein
MIIQQEISINCIRYTTVRARQIKTIQKCIEAALRCELSMLQQYYVLGVWDGTMGKLNRRVN